MTEETSKYTHVGVLKRTQKQIAILAKVAKEGQGVTIFELVDAWAKTAWEEAKEAGLVNDAMLPAIDAHWISADPAKKITKGTTKKKATKPIAIKTAVTA